MTKKRAMSLLEVTVATIIFGLTVAGLANIFLTGKRYIIHSRARMSGGELGRLFLEPLQAQVRQDTWNQVDANNQPLNDLNTGTRYCDGVTGHTQQVNMPCSTDRILNNLPYAARYDIDNFTMPSGTILRRVRTTVSWTELQP
jgi:type II secretory pathway pseudopilin PulG